MANDCGMPMAAPIGMAGGVRERRDGLKLRMHGYGRG